MIQAFGESDRPTSIDIDVTGSGAFSVTAQMYSGTTATGSMVMRRLFETVPIMSTDAVVRHYKFRCPKSTDYGNRATWSVAATGKLKVSIVARFSRKSPIEWQKPKFVEEPMEVVPLAEGTPDVVPRQWRYANTVAR